MLTKKIFSFQNFLLVPLSFYMGLLPLPLPPGQILWQQIVTLHYVNVLLLICCSCGHVGKEETICKEAGALLRNIPEITEIYFFEISFQLALEMSMQTEVTHYYLQPSVQGLLFC